MVEDLSSAPVPDVDIEEPIAIPVVSMNILKKIFQWCTYHRDDILPTDSQQQQQPNPTTNSSAATSEKVVNVSRPKEDISAWDAEFLKVDQGTLLEIITAANFLDIPDLLDNACRAVAAMIRGKTPEEIRRTFNIRNDFTAPEEEMIRSENEWCDFNSKSTADK